MTYYSEKFMNELTDAVNKCSPEVPRLLMRFINKGEYIGTPGLPEEHFNNIESLAYQFRNNCGCKILHEFERGILKPPSEYVGTPKKKK
jgi:hypothetical protein